MDKWRANIFGQITLFDTLATVDGSEILHTTWVGSEIS